MKSGYHTFSFVLLQDYFWYLGCPVFPYTLIIICFNCFSFFLFKELQVFLQCFLLIHEQGISSICLCILQFLLSMSYPVQSTGFSPPQLNLFLTITLCTRQQKRHWCIEKSFGHCGRGRGWDDLGEWHWNMYNINFETSRQSRFDAWYRMLGAGAPGWPRGMVWEGRWEGGSGWGTRVHLWLFYIILIYFHWTTYFTRVAGHNYIYALTWDCNIFLVWPWGAFISSFIFTIRGNGKSVFPSG